MRELRVVLLLAVGAAVGCGEATPPPAPGSLDSGFSLDAGTPDSGNLPDASVGHDAGSEPDSGTGEDGGSEPDGGTQMGCTAAEPEIKGLTKASAMALSAEGSEVWMTWSENRGGFPNAYAFRVGDKVEHHITDDANLVDQATVTQVGGTPLVAYRSNESGSYELYATTIGGTPHRLTNNSVQERDIAMVSTGRGVMATWLEDATQPGQAVNRSIKLRLLSADGSPTSEAHALTLSGQAPSAPTISRLDDVYAVAYSEGGMAFVQVVSDTGESIGVPVGISVEGWVRDKVTLVATDSGAVAVYTTIIAGVREEVRYRELDADGMPVGTPVQVTRGAETGSSPAILPFVGGRVVAYRTEGAEGNSTIRMKFFDSNDRLAGTVDAGAGASVGPTLQLGAVGATEVDVMFPGTETGVERVRVSCQ